LEQSDTLAGLPALAMTPRTSVEAMSLLQTKSSLSVSLGATTPYVSAPGAELRA